MLSRFGTVLSRFGSRAKHRSAGRDDQAFEGFDFRSSEDVLLKRFTLDAYCQEDTLNDYAMQLPVPEAQIILYDDVVIAEERVGCVR